MNIKEFKIYIESLGFKFTSNRWNCDFYRYEDYEIYTYYNSYTFFNCLEWINLIPINDLTA